MKKIISITLVLLVFMAASSTALAQESTQEGNRTETVETLFDKYNPTAKQTYLDLKAEHQSFHDERNALRLEFIQGYSSQISVITVQVADGTITPAEGKEQLQAVRIELTTFRENVKVVLEPKKAKTEAIKNQLSTLRASIKDALTQDEVVASQVAEYLEQFNDLLSLHLEVDLKYSALVDNILP